MKLRFVSICLSVILIVTARTMADVVSIGADKDNTLYESASGGLSNGSGEHMFAGETGAGELRRAVIAFDVAGNVPAGATIISVTLTLYMSRTIAGIETVTLHPLDADWGEGTSDATGPEGAGATATIGDATWLHTTYDSAFWLNPGGDFSANPSASADVGGDGFYTWGSTPELVADVQSWLDQPAANFGWVVIGNEFALTTSKRFDSRENVEVSQRPVLTINYTVTSGACCHGDGTCEVTTAEKCSEPCDHYLGDGTVCTGACFLQAPAPCCYPDGTCMEMQPCLCTADGGDPQSPFQSCADADCPLPMGACCRPTGTCEVTTPADCAGPCDQYRGDGTDCETSFCFVEVPAPCCYPDGSCVVLNPCLCREGGGTPKSPFLSCANADCPQPMGACCRPTGTCEVTTPDDCAGPCDQYRGDGTDCETSFCFVEAPAPCCYPDGSCVVMNPCLCREGGGDPQSPFLSCETADCPQPTGACCRPDGTCVVTTADECAGPCDRYRGDGTSCLAVLCFAEAPAPCCYPDGTCVEMNPCLCREGGGDPQSPFQSCATADCPQPTGGCCRPDGTCEITTADDCAGPCDQYKGDGTDCSTPCLVYRSRPCCLPNGTCVVISPCVCNAQGGTVQTGVATCAGVVCPPPAQPLQLAGNPLSAYPYFEFVRAYNFDAPVYIAIDPALHPDISGRNCDVYVVAAKSAAEWFADASLVDVRAGGPQFISFDGVTIQDNRFVIVDAADFTGDAGTDVGVGYDIVIDCDRDGFLDSGDYIDGLGDEAGMYIVNDLTMVGPLATTFADYFVTGISAPGHGAERTWYPMNIASMGQLPLVVISHGNGQQHTWYDYLQEHLASYGYIVMSHRTNSIGGPAQAALTTAQHTDAILGQQDTIAGGVLNGHIDSSRIVWIGQGRGGEGIVRAYQKIVSGEFTTVNYGPSDIALLSAIAPTDTNLGAPGSPDLANPLDAPFHLLYGAADGIVNGCAAHDELQPFNIYDRGTGPCQSTYIHGAGHNDFNCCGFVDADADPSLLLGRQDVLELVKGVYLPLIKHYVEGNIPSKDFLWRQYESLRPVGASALAVVDRLYREGDAAANFIVDDYQSQPKLNVSSSGGNVAYDVLSLGENILRDRDGEFTWMLGQMDCEELLGDFNGDGYIDSDDFAEFSACMMGPGVPVPPECLPGDFDGDGDVDFEDFQVFQRVFGTGVSCDTNGMTMAGAAYDDSKGAVLGWNGGADLYYDMEVIAAERDFSDDAYLAFRACQLTQHPDNVVDDVDLTFSVTLRDGNGVSSTINIGQYGGGIEDPFQRIGTNFSYCGPNAGWANEFEVIRIRITDFTHNAPSLDLTNIEAVRLDFGPSYGSATGRIGIDEIRVTGE
ncbi:MAG: DNRLRE domain-containing protein [Phycisphaerales bacterium]|nr:DNRLRE domain-containing protein [Phycisphaerales bacterium]MCB9862338.1 DNRLRE domain-containing protein [Phycisphaerales bacterium]